MVLARLQGAVAVEGEAMLWKPSPSNSLWDSRRLPSLPDMGPALNRSSSFEYESSSAGKAQDPAAARGEAAKAKALTASQGTSSEAASNAAAPVEAKETEDAAPGNCKGPGIELHMHVIVHRPCSSSYAQVLHWLAIASQACFQMHKAYLR
jgi:hypothetical protein